MIIDAKKLKIAMARACLGVADLGEKADVGRATIVRILRDDGENVRCKTDVFLLTLRRTFTPDRRRFGIDCKG